MVQVSRLTRLGGGNGGEGAVPAPASVPVTAMQGGEPKSTLLVFPELPGGELGHDRLSRLTWYLLPTLEASHEVLAVCPTGELPDTLQPIAYLDSDIPQHYARLRARMRTVKGFGEAELSGLPRIRAVFCLQKSRVEEARALAKGLGDAELVVIDPDTEQFESSKYLRFGSDDCRIPVPLLTAYKERFAKVRALCDNQTVGIFGTGPSLDNVTPETFAKCFNIATNSMIVDQALMDAVKPRIIVASDPIFHAGCSSYAADFRRQLIAQVKRHDAYFVFPARDFHIYEYYLREIGDRLIGIPMLPVHDLACVRNRDIDPPGDRYSDAFRMLAINDNLSERFFAVVTNNVMTFFLLPLAASLSSRAIGAGFDGRDPDADGYFWSHAKKSQINDKMEDIKVCHPGFFDIDYNQYYEAHTSTLTRQLHTLDAKGFEFACITHSFIPPLKARIVSDAEAFIAGRTPHAATTQSTAPPPAPAVSIIMPNFNVGTLIERALNSIQAQDFSDWELLIIDNGSNDRSLDAIARYAAVDPRIRVYHNPVPGVSGSRNMGLELARGKYVCFLDSDDELWSRSLSQRVQALETGAALCFGLAEFTNGRNQALGHTICARKDVNYKDFQTGNPVLTTTVMGRRSVIASERFREDLTNGEDYLFFARLARYGYTYKNIPARLACYRMHPDSTTQRDMFKHNRALKDVYNFLSTDMKGHPFFDARYTGGLPDGFFNSQTVARDFGSLVHVVVKNDAGAIARIVEQIDAVVVASRNEPNGFYHSAQLDMKVDSVEVFAVRALAEPKGSKALYKAVMASAPLAYEVITAWVHHNDVRGKMAERLRAFIRRAAKEAMGNPDELERRLGVTARLAAPSAPAAAEKPAVSATAVSPAEAPAAAPQNAASGPSQTPRLGPIAPAQAAAARQATLDLLDPALAPFWSLTHSGIARLASGALVIERQGQAYDRFATIAVRFSAPGEQELTIDCEFITHTVDVALDGRNIARVTGSGQHVIRFTSSAAGGRIAFSPANHPMSAARITRLVLRNASAPAQSEAGRIQAL